jgi:hypothetical protein
MKYATTPTALCRFRDRPDAECKKRRDAAAAEKWRLLQAQRLLTEFRRTQKRGRS